MLKLMKVEFRKLRTALLVIALTLVALEAGFVVGRLLEKENLPYICLFLIGFLTFAAYASILISGIMNYARELQSKTGYMLFMIPMKEWKILLSKLLFTAVMAIIVTALFGAAGYLDVCWLMRDNDVSWSDLGIVNTYARLFLRDSSFDLGRILLTMGAMALEVLISFLLIVCTAYLALTISATLFQSRKGFWRGLVSVVLFCALSYGASRLMWFVVDKVVYALPADADSGTYLLSSSGASLGVSAVFCAIFVAVSATLLRRKVNL